VFKRIAMADEAARNTTGAREAVLGQHSVRLSSHDQHFEFSNRCSQNSMGNMTIRHAFDRMSIVQR
jgi:hypothetical protein